jgi:catechol 2,3-dioxygenase-like lactoylglutathione lyase family enzyme
LRNPAFRFDHVHVIARDPHASARWYAEKLGATITADTGARGAPQIFVAVGGMQVCVRGKRPGEAPADRRPIRPFGDLSSHDEWGTDHLGFM